MTISKNEIIELLRKFTNQRSGIDYRNYSRGSLRWNPRSLRNEYVQSSGLKNDIARIAQSGRDARILLQLVENTPTITADDLRRSFSAYAGRLELKQEGDSKWRLSYCTGQYFPTEYRDAVCAVLSSAIWNYIRTMPNMESGDDIRKQARKMFGRGIASRWFN